MYLTRTLVIFTVVVLPTFNVYSKICDDINFCYMTFSAYPVELEGCENMTDSVSDGVQQSKSWCTLQCLQQNNCIAFSYDENRCALCDGDKISGIQQANNDTYFHLSRVQTVYQTNLATIYFTKDVVGRMIVFDFTVLLETETFVKANFFGSSNDKPIVVQCRLDLQNQIPFILVTSFINGSWLAGIHINVDPFPVQLGKRSRMYILISAHSFIVWIDGHFITEYPHILPVTDLSRMVGKGDVLVHELSV